MAYLIFRFIRQVLHYLIMQPVRDTRGISQIEPVHRDPVFMADRYSPSRR